MSTSAKPEPLALAFRDLNYTVSLKGQAAKKSGSTSKTILKNISGVCQPGRVMAIMGPSGAGKTTLLDVLAGRVLALGDLALGTKPRATPRDIAQRSAYVQQDDAIMASQTVREALQMAADLTLPRSTSTAERVALCEQLITTFHLSGAADTIVGDPVGRLKGISGGERKRLAVAMGAVREPQLIFLDEPTSGLDAHKAYVLINTLKGFANDKGSTVVCTIHQPSSDLFALFDDLMLLLYANPADFLFMHVLTASGDAVDDSRTSKLLAAWDASEERVKANAAVDAAFATSDGAKGLPLPPRSSRASPITQFKTLFKRAANDVKRNPMRGKAQVGQAIVFALIITLIWFQVSNDMNGVQDRMGVLFFFAANGMMSNIMGVLTTFANERAAVLREQENGMYASLPYFAARVLVDIPLKILSPTIFACIAYWSVGLRNDGARFGSAILTIILLGLSSNSFGLFLACIFPDVAVALLAAPLIIMPLMMFSGFFLNPESTPVYLKWLEWLSPMKYAFYALTMNEFEGLPLECTPDQMRIVSDPNGGPAITVCPVPDGDAHLASLNFQEWLTVPYCQLFLALEMLAFSSLAYAGLVLTSRRALRKARPRAEALVDAGEKADAADQATPV